MRTAFLLLLLGLAGCADDQPPPPSKLPTSQATLAEPPTPDEPATPAEPPPFPSEPPKPGHDAEPLPEPPKLDPANVHTPLTPDKSLLLETAADPANPGKRKPVRLLVECQTCPPAQMLEVLLCKTNSKEHEAIIRTAVDARLIHSGLVAVGLEPGSPATFINPKTDEPEYRPATGSKVAVAVHYRKGGELHTHPAQEWIRDIKSKKPMSHAWVFAGSRFIPYPGVTDKPPYYAANGGDVIGVSNFPDSMLDLPVELTADNENLAFEAATERLPPPLSKVWLVLSAATEMAPAK